MLRMPAFGMDAWRDHSGFAETTEQVSGIVWLTGTLGDRAARAVDGRSDRGHPRCDRGAGGAGAAAAPRGRAAHRDADGRGGAERGRGAHCHVVGLRQRCSNARATVDRRARRRASTRAAVTSSGWRFRSSPTSSGERCARRSAIPLWAREPDLANRAGALPATTTSTAASPSASPNAYVTSWSPSLMAAGVHAAPVWDQNLQDELPQLVARGFTQWLDHRSPGASPTRDGPTAAQFDTPTGTGPDRRPAHRDVLLHRPGTSRTTTSPSLVVRRRHRPRVARSTVRGRARRRLSESAAQLRGPVELRQGAVAGELACQRARNGPVDLHFDATIGGRSARSGGGRPGCREHRDALGQGRVPRARTAAQS